jgi:hypothetical protein
VNRRRVPDLSPLRCAPSSWVLSLFANRPQGGATAKLKPFNYLPIKIKMPAMSATIPITIAPMPM